MSWETVAKKLTEKTFYQNKSIFGYFNDQKNCRFAILLGGRQAGKTYFITEQFLKDNMKYDIPFYVFRLTEAAMNKLLKNNAEKLIDPPLYRKYLTNKGWTLKTKGNQVYRIKKDENGKVVKQVLLATVKALSTFYSDKGEATFDFEWLDKNKHNHYNILIDEFQKEANEKSQGDLCYQFVNALENILRNTKKRIRCFMTANMVEDCSDILAGCFNFIPEKFGRYYLATKHCVIDYIAPTEAYMKMRKDSVADILLPDASTFTNEIKIDTSLITKKRLIKPAYIIKFTKDPSHWFSVWDDGIIAKYNGEHGMIVAMRPYIDEKFNTALRDDVITRFDNRFYLYHSLLEFKLFQMYIRQIKPRK